MRLLKIAVFDNRDEPRQAITDVTRAHHVHHVSVKFSARSTSADFVVRDKASNSRTAKWGCFQPGWALSLIDTPLTEFNQSIIKCPNIKRFLGGASKRHDPEP